MNSQKRKYDDEYPTCDRTYITLRIYPKMGKPNEVTKRLGVRPSKIQVKGESDANGRSTSIDAWFLTTKEKVDSKDSRRHLDWILKKLDRKENIIQGMLKRGDRIDLACYWRSKNGHGGPTQNPRQMGKIGELGIELWYDFYA